MMKMTIERLNKTLRSHGLISQIMGDKIYLYDVNGKVYDTVELLECDDHTMIKTCEYDSIRLLYWLGY